MKPIETIDECINEIQSKLECWRSIKDDQPYWESAFGPFNNPTKEEIDDNILMYQQHLDNLYFIKKELNYE